MSISSRLTEVFRHSPEISFDDTSKYLLISDCHRGIGDAADDFLCNKDIFVSTLKHYFDRGFTYIEVGDTDELWKNDNLEDILRTYPEIFSVIREYHIRKRLHLIWGNHDNKKKDGRILFDYLNKKAGKRSDVPGKNTVDEGLVFIHKPTGGKIFVVHGHQGSLLSDTLWPIGKFGVRCIGKRLEFLGIDIDKIISPSHSPKRRGFIEEACREWVEENKVMLIFGHTHRYYAPREAYLYANTGCCIWPEIVIGIVIEGGKLSLLGFKQRAGEALSVELIKEEGSINPIRLAALLKLIEA